MDTKFPTIYMYISVFFSVNFKCFQNINYIQICMYVCFKEYVKKQKKKDLTHKKISRKKNLFNGCKSKIICDADLF